MGGDTYPTVRVAAVQAAPVFLDREGTVEKSCRLIEEAAAGGAQVIAFPEGFIPSHPIWYHHHPATGRVSNRFAVELFKNSLQVPSSDFDTLCSAARDANAYVVMGACEKLPDTTGTMYNSQLFIGPHGILLGRHVKVMPTVGERLVHAGGYGDTMRAVQTEFGPLSALICAENTNPLVVFTMIAQNPRIHVISWPGHFPTSGDPMRVRVSVDSRAVAQMSKAFVISSCGTVDEDTIAKLQVGSEGEAFLRNPACCGGSVIVGPNQQVLAGPMGAEEGIIYADCNLEMNVAAKLRHDFVGHSGRPDIFRLWVDESRPRLYNPFTCRDVVNSSREGGWVASSLASPAEDEPDCGESLP
jgi:nitrilase